MIRLAFMTDPALVIGASTEEANLARYPLLPAGLAPEMTRVYAGHNIAAGESSYRQTVQATGRRYVITRNKDFDLTGEVGLEVCTDPQELVERYQDSAEELLVVGGLSMFRYFAPFALQFDVAMSDHRVPGDLVFDDWTRQGLSLISRAPQDGFDMLTYRRA